MCTARTAIFRWTCCGAPRPGSCPRSSGPRCCPPTGNCGCIDFVRWRAPSWRASIRRPVNCWMPMSPASMPGCRPCAAGRSSTGCSTANRSLGAPKTASCASMRCSCSCRIPPGTCSCSAACCARRCPPPCGDFCKPARPSGIRPSTAAAAPSRACPAPTNMTCAALRICRRRRRQTPCGSSRLWAATTGRSPARAPRTVRRFWRTICISTTGCPTSGIAHAWCRAAPARRSTPPA